MTDPPTSCTIPEPYPGIIIFVPKGKKGVHVGKKHFRSIEEAEAYIMMLNINGFSVSDL